MRCTTSSWLGLFQGERGGRAFRQVLSEGAHRPGADWSLVEQAIAVTAARPPEAHGFDAVGASAQK